MGIVSKSSIKFSAISYFGILLGYLNTVIIFPNLLSEEEFGLTRLIFIAASLISQLAQLGIGNILIRFHPYLKDDKKNSTLSLGIIISLIGIALSATVLLGFDGYIKAYYNEKSALFSEYFYLLLPAVISLIVFNLFNSYLRVLLKNSFAAILESVVLRLVWLGVVLLYGFGYFDTTTFLHIYVAGHISTSIALIIYAAKVKRFNLGFPLDSERWTLFKNMSKYGLVTIVSGLSLFLINKIDMMMVGSYVGLAEVGVYSIALYMSMVIMVPASSISRTTAVLTADAFKSGNSVLIKELYQKTALHQLLLGGMIYLLILINYESLMSFLPDHFKDSFMVFFYLGLAKIVDTGLGINGAILINSKYYKMDTVLSVGLLILSVIMKIYFIPTEGIIGAAFSTALALIIFNIIKYLILKLKLKLSPFTTNYIKALLIIVLPLPVIYITPHFGNFLIDVPLKSGIYLAIAIPLLYFLNISAELNGMLHAVIRRIQQIL